MNKEQMQPQRQQLQVPKEITDAEKQPPLKTATKDPGRVVVLNTNRGTIEFVLFEKDCPKTTARIADLVQRGKYNGVKFPRAENWVIQTEQAKEKVPPMDIEVAKDLTHAKGSVGMARPADPHMNTSVFYITLEPAHHLDLQYTNFGRVINGMDTAMKIRKGDVIKTATVRPLTAADKKLFFEVLQIESDRKTQ